MANILPCRQVSQCQDAAGFPVMKGIENKILKTAKKWIASAIHFL